MERQITLNLTEVEASNLLQIIDIAVKSGGLQIAGPAITIASKIQVAATKKTELTTTNEVLDSDI